MTENKVLPKGSDINKLYTDQMTRDITIDFKGEGWDFTVRDLTWKEKGQCVTDGTDIKITGNKKNSKKSIQMNMVSYNISYMMKSVVKAPFPVTIPSFMKLDADFGELLVAAIVNPEDMGDDEEGNSEDQLEV